MLSVTISSSIGEMMSVVEVSSSGSTSSEEFFSLSTDFDFVGIEPRILENEFLSSLGRNLDTGE